MMNSGRERVTDRMINSTIDYDDMSGSGRMKYEHARPAPQPAVNHSHPHHPYPHPHTHSHGHGHDSTPLLEIHHQLERRSQENVDLYRENLQLAEENSRLDSVIRAAKHQALELAAKLKHFETDTIPALAKENELLRRQVEEAARRERRGHTVPAGGDDDGAGLGAGPSSSSSSSSDLRRQLAALRTEHAALQSQLFDSQSHLRSTQRDLDESQRSLREKDDEIDHLRKQLKQAQDARDSYIDHLHQLQTEHDDLRARGSTESEELASLKQECDILKQHAELSKSSMKLLNEQHAELQERYEAALEESRQEKEKSHQTQLELQRILDESAPTPRGPSDISGGKKSDPTDLEDVIRQHYALKSALLRSKDSLGAASSSISSTPIRSSFSTISSSSPLTNGQSLRIRQDCDASLQSLNLLRNQAALVTVTASRTAAQESARRRNHELEAALREHEELINNLRQQLSRQNKEVVDAHASIADLQQQLQHAQNEVQTHQHHRHQRSQSEQQQLATLMEEVRVSHNQSSDLRAQLAAQSHALEKSLEQIKHLQFQLRDKHNLEQALEKIAANLQTFANVMEQTKTQRKEVAKEVYPRTHNLWQQMQHEARARSAANASVAAGEAGSKYTEKQQALAQAILSSMDDDASSHDFDYDTHLRQLLHPSTSTGDGSTNGQPAVPVTKYDSIFSILLHDLSPVLTHYTHLLHAASNALQAFDDASRAWPRDRDRMQAELDQLRRQAQQTQQQMQHIQQQHDDSIRQVQQLQGTNQKLEGDKDQLQRDLQRMAAEHDSLTRRNDALQSERDSFARDNGQLAAEKDDALHRSERLEQQLKTSREEIVRLKNEYQRDKDETEKQVKSLHEESRAKQSQASKQFDDLHAQLSQANTSNASLQSELDSLRRQLIATEERLRDLEESQDRSTRDANRRQRELMQELEQKNRAMEELNEVKAKLEHGLEQSRAGKKEIEHQLREFDGQHEALRRALNDRTKERDTALNECMKLETALMALRDKHEKDVSTLNKELDAASDKLSSERTEAELLRSDLEKAKQIHAIRVDKLYEQYGQLQSDLKSAQSRTAQVEEELHASKECLASYERKLGEISRALESTEREASRVMEDARLVQKELERLKKREKECQRLHVGEWEPQLHKLQGQVHEQNKSLSEVRRDLGHAQRRVEEKEREMEEELHRSHVTFDDQSEQLREVEQRLATTQSHLDRLLALLGLEWSEVLALLSDANGGNALRERARALFSQDQTLSIEQLHRLVVTQHEHIEESKRENAQLEEMVKQLKKEIQTARDQKITEHSTMDKLLSANRRLQAFIDSLPATTSTSFSSSSSVRGAPSAPATARSYYLSSRGGSPAQASTSSNATPVTARQHHTTADSPFSTLRPPPASSIRAASDSRATSSQPPSKQAVTASASGSTTSRVQASDPAADPLSVNVFSSPNRSPR